MLGDDSPNLRETLQRQSSVKTSSAWRDKKQNVAIAVLHGAVLHLQVLRGARKKEGEWSVRPKEESEVFTCIKSLQKRRSKESTRACFCGWWPAENIYDYSLLNKKTQEIGKKSTLRKDRRMITENITWWSKEVVKKVMQRRQTEKKT